MLLRDIETNITKLKEMECQTVEARDYPACMYIYGAIIYFERFLGEMRGKHDK